MGVVNLAFLTTEDSLGNVVRNYYDENNGRLLATLNEGTGDGTTYVYDTIGRVIMVAPAEYASSVKAGDNTLASYEMLKI